MSEDVPMELPQEVGTEIDITPDQGIKKKIVKAGPCYDRPCQGADVFVHYVGTLQTDGSEFDSSRKRGEPFSFKLGAGAVIKGWDLGVATMNVGEMVLRLIFCSFLLFLVFFLHFFLCRPSSLSSLNMAMVHKLLAIRSLLTPPLSLKWSC
jgi:hypothetical protein